MFLPHQPQPMSAVRYLAGLVCPMIYGALARKSPVDLRKVRRFMSFVSKIDGDQITAGVSAIDQTIRQDGSSPGLAAENLGAGGGLEAVGRDGCDHQLTAGGEGDDLAVGDDD